jgi:hypothetical protein
MPWCASELPSLPHICINMQARWLTSRALNPTPSPLATPWPVASARARSPLAAQVVVLSEGVQLFAGAPPAAVPWFAGALGYPFEPAADGAAPDWLMDLVSVGFAKPSGYARRRALSAPCLLCEAHGARALALFHGNS